MKKGKTSLGGKCPQEEVTTLLKLKKRHLKTTLLMQGFDFESVPFEGDHSQKVKDPPMEPFWIKRLRH